MDLAAVVVQLKQYAPVFSCRVAGAADFATGLESTVWPDLPAAYVIPLEDEADGNDEQTGLQQLVTQRIGVVVEFDNTADRRGQGVTLNYATMRAALFAALLNWNADPMRGRRGMAYAGGHMLQFDRNRLFFQWEFALEIWISEADGFQPGAPPLLEIDANTNPGDPPFPAHVALPQLQE